jgi:glycosyltransferase involved in cell wall biosynthesis
VQPPERPSSPAPGARGVAPVIDTRLRYPRGLDAEVWAARHGSGEVPDQWPYGLHRLLRPGLHVQVEPPPGAVTVAASRGVRACTGGAYDWVPRPHRASAPDVALAWDERVGIPMALTAPAGTRVATGVIWLTDRVPRPAALRWLERRALGRCAAVWALSSAQLPVLRREWGVESVRLHHLRFGVDRDFWFPGPDARRSGTVLVVGNDRDRDHGTAIRAVEAVRTRHPGVQVHVVSGRQVEVPPELGKRTPVLTHDALRREYQAADVCVVALRPNRHCSGLTTVLEAMACGRPVIVTGTPGMGDYVRHGREGLLVPPGDVSTLAAAITRVLDNPGLAAELGQAAREAVDRAFNTERQAEQLSEILCGL